MEMSRPDGPENLIVHRGQCAFIILNRFPYNSGHLMVVPYEHKPTLEELGPETRAELMELGNLATRVLQEVYHPHGFNLGVNVGTAAGAGILEHVHMHVLPRWNGDTNFISTLGATRVLPESLEDTYRRVKEGIEKLT
jgi:ATP adenylyltransferase